jgi:hypothetical protein
VIEVDDVVEVVCVDDCDVELDGPLVLLELDAPPAPFALVAAESSAPQPAKPAASAHSAHR